MGERHQTDTSEPQVDYDFTGSGVLVIKLSGNWTLKESPPDSEVTLRRISDTNETFELYASEPNGNNNRKLSGILTLGGDVFSFDWVP